MISEYMGAVRVNMLYAIKYHIYKAKRDITCSYVMYYNILFSTIYRYTYILKYCIIRKSEHMYVCIIPQPLAI